MSNIKDVAQLAGVSQSTVSIVLNGKSLDRKISQATQQKVMDAVKKLDYHPNISARKLRDNIASNTITIALYWANDFRTSMLSRFLKGLERGILQSKRKLEVIIFPYTNNELCKDTALLSGTKFNAAIIANASAEDMKYLESIQPTMPVVLYNRTSDSYCSVNVNDHLMGHRAAELFFEYGHSTLGIMTSDYIFSGMEIRDQSFIRACRDYHMHIRSEHMIVTENSIPGGVSAVKTLLKTSFLPDGIFCASDALAYGALHAFHQAGIKVPEDISLISIGNGDIEQSKYCIPPLTVVHLPMEDMATECIGMIQNLLDHKTSPYKSVLLDTPLIVRDTTRVRSSVAAYKTPST